MWFPYISLYRKLNWRVHICHFPVVVWPVSCCSVATFDLVCIPVIPQLLFWQEIKSNCYFMYLFNKVSIWVVLICLIFFSMLEKFAFYSLSSSPVLKWNKSRIDGNSKLFHRIMRCISSSWSVVVLKFENMGVHI